MSMTWGSRFRLLMTSSRTYLKAGWLVTAGIVALYVGAIRPYEDVGGGGISRLYDIAPSRGGGS